MKQYVSVIIVFVVCILAILFAWLWRISQKDNHTNIEKVVQNIQIYSNEPVNIYKEN